MIDIGVNLTSSQFNKDWHKVIAAALQTDVQAMIVTGTDLQQSLNACQMSMDYPGVLYSTAGIHPHDANTLDLHSMEQLARILANRQVVAVGECGLDFNRNYSSRTEQLACFEAQLQLAADLKLPVFLHQRDAWKDFLELLKRYRHQLVDAVAHCFTAGRTELKMLLDLDLHIGITGWICDERRGKDLQDCVSMIPLDRVMLETDAPYLLPRDLNLISKGNRKLRRNEPKYLSHIAAAVADYMAVDVEKLKNSTTANSRRFFRL